jgi:hypothetical protein
MAGSPAHRLRRRCIVTDGTGSRTLAAAAIESSLAEPQAELGRRLPRAIHWIGVPLAGVVFTAVWGYQAPFVRNQHTYFVHGLAAAGWGQLAHDPLVQTTDAFPLFSLLIEMIYRSAGDPLVLLVQILVGGVYLWSLCAIALRLFPALARPAAGIAFLALLLGLHSLALRGVDLGPYQFARADFVSGVASHSLMAGYLVQQNFGVFLVASIAAFLYGRHYWAGILIGIGASFHPAYLLPGATLTLAYLLQVGVRDRRPFRALRVGAVTLASVLPVAAYVMTQLGATSGETLAQAHELLARVRVPHHALPDRWLWSESNEIEPVVAFKTAWVLAALVLLRKTPLLLVMALQLAVVVVFTAWVSATDSYTVAIMYPWRGSILLLPLATMALVGAGVTRALNALEGRVAMRQAIGAVAGVAIAVLAGIGAWSSIEKRDLRRLREWQPIFQEAHRIATPETLFLIPPNLRSFHGFRIHAAAPTFVDWKSHPFRDVDVIDWYERITLARQAYGTTGRIDGIVSCSAVQRAVERYGVTHVISWRQAPSCPGFDAVHTGSHYVIYRVGLPDRI